jgi:FAD/FMN-containing dehydrogenase
MNKIAQYLNEHILGEVNVDLANKQRFSHDGSILCVTPEIVIHPRVTNDIRKIARFSWQLAEKGHILPITVRGGGSNKSGAAIGRGIVINTSAHLNKTIFINLKSKDLFAHVQPGVNLYALNETLRNQGLTLPVQPASSGYTTVGGSIADNISGTRYGNANYMGDLVQRLELVLSNGDLIEISRLSKHELNKKKGLQTFEGEIYRKIDGIIEDNRQIIDNKIANNPPENAGYTGIARVKERNGSFDLTPLIIGSQGTLGIVSEAVFSIQPSSDEESLIVATFDDSESARDAADDLAELAPSELDYLDGELFDIAHGFGKKYIFSDQYEDKSAPTVLFIKFDDIKSRSVRKMTKQALKKLSKTNATTYTGADYSDDELAVVRDVESVILHSAKRDESRPNILDGASIPGNRREEFIAALAELTKKHHVTLPLHIEWLSGHVYTSPTLNLHTVSDKQKTFKLISDYIELVARYGGGMAADGGEGRLRANAAYSQLDEDELDIYDQIKATFDPFGIMNTGVKQKSDLKTLVSQLDPSYDNADLAPYSPVN